jgi:sterol desaturase/sphingolipid hydroxylase (fatty acid hydroxylase superfamily)
MPKGGCSRLRPPTEQPLRSQVVARKKRRESMELTQRELWAVIHGLVLGSVFLLAFAGGLAGLWSLRERYLTAEGVHERMPRLLIGTWVMALIAWLTVITGTFIVYPWYRATPPKGTDLTNPAALVDYPRY